ncbi:MAG: leucyl/phenylalanyl-tRNA--protein transferase [Spirochaetales bacterium]|nr:leucyl/phenylalanyl-tRNA--protein transferase [Spirochaetales bacterium]
MRPGFPYLSEDERFEFPSPDTANEDGIVCVGGNLSPGMLLSAYSQGLFPWFSEHDPILWWSPDPRFVVFPAEAHISASMRKVMRQGRFELKLDTSFDEVIRACSGVKRPGQRGTWITADMRDAYCCLHELGYAHCVEAWTGENLAGGLYGVCLGKIFFGESMFSRVSNASKAAFLFLVSFLRARGFGLIDSQVRTDHVASLGGRAIARTEYLELLSRLVRHETPRGNWSAVAE